MYIQIYLHVTVLDIEQFVEDRPVYLRLQFLFNTKQQHKRRVEHPPQKLQNTRMSTQFQEEKGT